MVARPTRTADDFMDLVVSGERLLQVLNADEAGSHPLWVVDPYLQGLEQYRGRLKLGRGRLTSLMRDQIRRLREYAALPHDVRNVEDEDPGEDLVRGIDDLLNVAMAGYKIGLFDYAFLCRLSDQAERGVNSVSTRLRELWEYALNWRMDHIPRLVGEDCRDIYYFWEHLERFSQFREELYLALHAYSKRQLRIERLADELVARLDRNCQKPGS